MKAKMSFLTLIGVLIPTAAVWAPFLLSAKSDSDRKFRKTLFWIELALFIIFFGLSVLFWMKQINNIEHGSTIDNSNIFVMILYPVFVLLFGLGMGVYQLNKDK